MSEPEREAFEAHIKETESREPLLWSTVFANSISGETMPAHFEGKYFIQADQKAWLAWQARAALPSTSAKGDAGEWQAIETAPQGTLILCCNMNAAELRNWAFVDWLSNGKFCGNRHNVATHWMPLPAAPKETP